jgi:hypothetical protein
MPGSITHTYITYLCFQQAVSEQLFKFEVSLSEILKMHDLFLMPLAKDGVDSYDKYTISTDGTIIVPSYAYIGCNGPDLYYMAAGNPDENGKPGADILHYNKTGPNVIWALRQLKAIRNRREYEYEEVCKLAYWLGHISHIAADVIVHPFVNSIVAAYPDDHCEYDSEKEKGTGNSRFEPFGGWASSMNLFKFHNVIEHWQDAYVLRRIMIPQERAGFKNWESVNLCAAAAKDLLRNPRQYFILKNLEYYGYYNVNDLKRIGIEIKNYTEGNLFEKDKFTLMSHSNLTPPDVDWYINKVLPPEGDVNEHLEDRPNNNIIQPRLLEEYISRAVKFTMNLWREVDQYFSSKTVDTESENEYDMEESKKYFPLLRRHWNLDTGFAPRVSDREDNYLTAEYDPKSKEEHIDTEYEPKLITTKKNLIEVHLPFVINYESHMEGGNIDDITI